MSETHKMDVSPNVIRIVCVLRLMSTFSLANSRLRWNGNLLNSDIGLCVSRLEKLLLLYREGHIHDKEKEKSIKWGKKFGKEGENIFRPACEKKNMTDPKRVFHSLAARFLVLDDEITL